MKRVLAITLVSTLSATGTFAAELSDATVEKTLGIAGVSHTAKTNTRYGQTYADVAYKIGDKGIVTLRIGNPEQYAAWKQAMAQDASPVSGVGSDAFVVNSFRSVCASTASSAVCVTPSALHGKQITQEQIVALVKAAL
ncbi:hypothetical protein [Piscinibacter terrae]|uniref:Uncharacterized protein n=1 Tax=Piscinibacter terrae TaxID=2496871 RepID=A0A3N7HLQ8_9BURK|nr:hypothetical protein [Albitalea terrae]RQP22513.1 hypothetical protein DZC73_23095 [Albitalea terrae]